MEHLKDLYSEEKLQVKKKIDNAFAVALTIDFWTSCSVDLYLGVTVHFITEDWKLSSFILQTAELKERHTITNIADLLNDVTDKPIKAGNIVGAVHYLGWKHQACFAHTLQLSIKAGLQLHSVSQSTHMCWKIVGHFKHSVVAQNALEEKQEALGISKKINSFKTWLDWLLDGIVRMKF